jgi:Tol biopolymer transport system component
MRLSVFLVWTMALLTWCGTASAGTYRAFADPRMVTIAGYSGSAMEPFISRDGDYLLFNTSNVAPNIPALQFATRINAQTFEYQGQILGEAVNEPEALSGTPTMAQDGTLYFVSPRSYSQTLSTIYSGQFSSGVVSGVHLVAGVFGGTPGTVDFDVEVSADGEQLYVSAGHFEANGTGPTSASIELFDKVGGGFVPDPHSAKLLRKVNGGGQLDYAASISTNGLELFFTRASPSVGQPPAIYRAARASISRPFTHVQRVAAITGFAEAPSISADGSTLYYHALIGGQYEIESVTRP